MEKLSYTITEACTAIGIGRTTLYEFIKKGELPVIKIGSRTLIEHSALEALLANCRKAA